MRRFIRNPRYREPEDVRDQEADGQQDEQQDDSSSSKSKEKVWQEETDD